MLKSSRPVILEFMSSNCPACKGMEPQILQITEKFRGRVYVYQMDITRSKKWENYNVTGVPTLIYFSHGKDVDRQVGTAELQEIEEKLKRIL